MCSQDHAQLVHTHRHRILSACFCGLRVRRASQSQEAALQEQAQSLAALGSYMCATAYASQRVRLEAEEGRPDLRTASSKSAGRLPRPARTCMVSGTGRAGAGMLLQH